MWKKCKLQWKTSRTRLPNKQADQNYFHTELSNSDIGTPHYFHTKLSSSDIGTSHYFHTKLSTSDIGTPHYFHTKLSSSDIGTSHYFHTKLSNYLWNWHVFQLWNESFNRNSESSAPHCMSESTDMTTISTCFVTCMLYCTCVCVCVCAYQYTKQNDDNMSSAFTNTFR